MEIITALNPITLVMDYLNQRVTATGRSWWVATEWTIEQPTIVQVSRAGGARWNLVVDRPQMLIEVWAPTEVEAEDAGAVIEAWITALPNANVAVHRVEWLSGPVSFPDNNKRPRVQLSFYLRTRMQATQEA